MISLGFVMQMQHLRRDDVESSGRKAVLASSPFCDVGSRRPLTRGKRRLVCATRKAVTNAALATTGETDEQCQGGHAHEAPEEANSHARCLGLV